MADLISVQSLFESFHEKLQLSWLAGRKGRQKVFKRDSNKSMTLIGRLDFVHPRKLVVINKRQINEINSHGSSQLFEQIFNSQPVLLILCDNVEVPPALLNLANAKATALWVSRLPSLQVINELEEYLSKQLSMVTTVHGVFMDVLGLGVLLTGRSGIGKSELALGLVNRGHRLIADDAPNFQLANDSLLIGTCPGLLQDFLEVRGLGILNIRAMFGDTSIQQSKHLQLIIKIVASDDEQMQTIDRLHGMYSKRSILGVDIPQVMIPVAAGRNLSALVEGAVRNQVLRLTGYDASAEFLQRQKELMEAKDK